MCVCACTCTCVCVIGFAKTSQIAQELKFNLLLNIKRTLLHHPETPNIWLYRWPSLLHRQLFTDPVKPPRYTTGSVEPVNGINNDVSGTILLPTTVLTYPVD